MADKPFVINDRRKFTSEGELRPDAPPSEPKPIRDDSPIQSSAAHAVESTGPKLVETPAPTAAEAPAQEEAPTLTAEQTQQASSAYDATVDRLDTAIRAQNPGMDRIPEMTFERLVQSIYMQSIMQLGLATEPGQTPQVDLLGARQSIDMLAIIHYKSKSNLTDPEAKLIDAALFEMRMGFLEVTQALARQAASRAQETPPTGPSIVR